MEARFGEALKNKNWEATMETVLEEYGETNSLQYMLDQPTLNIWATGTEVAVLVNPGAVPEGGNQAAIALYTLQKKEFVEQGKLIKECRTRIITYLDEGTKADITPNEGDRLSTLPLRDIFTRLKEKFVRMNPEREAQLYEIIGKKITSDESFAEEIAKTVNGYRELRTMGLTATEADMVKMIGDKISNEDGVWSGRETLQTLWNRENPTRATRTATRLIDTIKRHDEMQPKAKKAGEQFAGAAKASGGKQETFCVTKVEMRKIIEEENRARGGKNNGGGGGAGGGGGQYKGGGSQYKGGGGAGGRITPGPPGTLKTFFCSTHGWNWYHMSRKCLHKHRDHRDDETEAQRRIRLSGDPNNDRI